MVKRYWAAAVTDIEAAPCLVEGWVPVHLSSDYDALAAELARCRSANAYDAEALRQLELARERIQHLNAGIYIVHTMRLNWGLACPCKCSECDILFEGIRDHLPEGSEQEREAK